MTSTKGEWLISFSSDEDEKVDLLNYDESLLRKEETFYNLFNDDEKKTDTLDNEHCDFIGLNNDYDHMAGDNVATDYLLINNTFDDQYLISKDETEIDRDDCESYLNNGNSNQTYFKDGEDDEKEDFVYNVTDQEAIQMNDVDKEDDNLPFYTNDSQNESIVTNDEDLDTYNEDLYKDVDWTAPCTNLTLNFSDTTLEDNNDNCVSYKMDTDIIYKLKKCYEQDHLALYQQGKAEDADDSLPTLTLFKVNRSNRSNGINNKIIITARYVKLFLDCLLSLPVDDIINDNTDMMLNLIESTYAICREWSPKPLPLAYGTAQEYRRDYTPYIILDTWAQWAKEYALSNISKLSFGCIDIRTKRTGPHLRLQAKVADQMYRKYKEAYNFEKFVVILEFGDERCCGLIDSVNFYEKYVFVEDNIPIIDQNSQDLFQDGNFDFTMITYSVRVSNLGFMDLVSNSLAVEGCVSFMNVKPLFYLRPAIRLIDTLTIMEEHPLRYKFFEKFLSPTDELCSIKLEEIDENEFKLEDGDRFNEQQRKAILGTLDAIKQPDDKVVMIQGPPGTGKTHTLLGLIKNIFTNLSDDGDEIRIMICAPSNGAIDEIGRRLINKNMMMPNGKPLKLVRIGQRSQVHSSMLHLHIDSLMENSADNKSDQLRRILLEEANVIITTLASSHYSGMEFMRKQQSEHSQFSCIIVDEASQCSEPELLMPLVYSVNKLILIGDPLQLPATIISNYALKMNYGRSMFERFYEYFKKKNGEDHAPLVMLEQQFRMHPDIVHLPSLLFYNNRLKTMPGTGISTKVQLKPYLVFDIVNTYEQGGGMSYSNHGEAQFVLSLLQMIFCSVVYHKVKIGVITFYRGQKQLLLDELHQYKGGMLLKAGIEVDTVDAYQGQERDIIVLSCVRAGQGNVGFVRSTQRMNVALTRAKSAMYICLNRQAFNSDPTWRQLIDDAQDRGCLQTAKSNVDLDVLKGIIRK